MTSPVAVVGLHYDAEDLQRPDLGVFIEVRKGLSEPPTVRGTDTIVPSAEGRMEGLRVKDMMPIELFGVVQPDEDITDSAEQQASFRTNVRYVRTLFMTDRVAATLSASMEDGSLFFVEARPLNAIWTETIPGYQATVSIQMEGFGDWQVDEAS